MLKSVCPNFFCTGRGQKGVKNEGRNAAEYSTLQSHSKGRVGCVYPGATGKSISSSMLRSNLLSRFSFAHAEGKWCDLLERTRPELGRLGASFTNTSSPAVHFPMYGGMCKPGAPNPTGSGKEQRGSCGKQTTPMAPCQKTRPLVGRFETKSTNALSPVVTFQCTGDCEGQTNCAKRLLTYSSLKQQ